MQDFSFENSTAAVRAYASYSDGYMNDVTDLPGLNITSLAVAYITVNDTVGNITVGALLLMLAHEPIKSSHASRTLWTTARITTCVIHFHELSLQHAWAPAL